MKHRDITVHPDPAFAELWEHPDADGLLTVLRTSDGDAIPQPVARWFEPPGPEEQEALYHCVAPVLDVGCGPGRHVVALNDCGKSAVGIDASAGAVAIAAAHGAVALRRSVFDRVPGRGRWATALLLDGNIGIGGNPVALLHRLGELLSDRGVVIVEVGPPGSGTRRTQARLERGSSIGKWFSWAFVADDGLERLAAAAGFQPARRWSHRDRWFASLQRIEMPDLALEEAATP